MQERKLHAHVRVFRPAPADLRVEDVGGLFGEVPCDVGVGDLPPAVGFGHRQVDILPPQGKADHDHEDQPEINATEIGLD